MMSKGEKGGRGGAAEASHTYAFPGCCIFQYRGHGYSVPCNMHGAERAAITLEATGGGWGRGNGVVSAPRGWVQRERRSGQNGGLTGARVTLRTPSKLRVPCAIASLKAARKGYKQLKIYGVWFLFKHRAQTRWYATYGILMPRVPSANRISLGRYPVSVEVQPKALRVVAQAGVKPWLVTGTVDDNWI